MGRFLSCGSGIFSSVAVLSSASRRLLCAEMMVAHFYCISCQMPPPLFAYTKIANLLNSSQPLKKKCNCRKKEGYPLQGKCQTKRDFLPRNGEKRGSPRRAIYIYVQYIYYKKDSLATILISLFFRCLSN